MGFNLSGGLGSPPLEGLGSLLKHPLSRRPQICVDRVKWEKSSWDPVPEVLGRQDSCWVLRAWLGGGFLSVG